LRLAALVGVLDDHAKAHLPILVPDRSENPDAGAVHLDDHVGTFRRREKQRIDASLRRHRVAVERDHGKAMAGQRQRDVLGRAGVEQPEQHALAFADADGRAMAEHLVVERCRGVHHLEAVVGRRTCADVLHAHPGAFPVVGSEQHFLVITAWIVGWLDNQEAVHPRVQASRQIRTGNVVAVIPPRPCRLRGEGVPGRSMIAFGELTARSASVLWSEGRLLFARAPEENAPPG
jgi:hypothetical protein